MQVGVLLRKFLDIQENVYKQETSGGIEMKIICLAASLLLIFSVSYSADMNQSAGELIKKLFEKSQLENGTIKAVRYFQFTATKESENSCAWLFNKEDYDPSIVEDKKELGLKNSDKGKYLPSVKNRSAARLHELWKSNRSMIFRLLNARSDNDDISAYVGWLIAFHDADRYSAAIAEMKKRSPRLDENTLEIAEKTAGEESTSAWPNSGLNYGHYCSRRDALAFWYRRTAERNDREVYAILKEIKAELDRKNVAAGETD